MSYGIARVIDGANTGLQQAKQDRRQGRFDDLREDQSKLNMAATRQSMQAREQLMGQREQDQEWTGQQRERATQEWETQQQAQQTAQQVNQAIAQYYVTKDPSALFSLHEQFTGRRPEQVDENTVVILGDDGKPVRIPMEGNGQQPGYLDLSASFATPDGALKLLEAQNAQQVAAAEAKREMQAETFKQGEWAEDAEGNTAYRIPGETYQAPTDQMDDNATAKMRDTVFFADRLGISEQKAAEMILRAKQQPRDETIREMAAAIAEARGGMRMSYEETLDEAERIYNDRFAPEYGVPSPGSSGQAPAQSVDPNQFNDEFRMATQAVAAGKDIEQVASMMRQRGVPEDQVQQWKARQ